MMSNTVRLCCLVLLSLFVSTINSTYAPDYPGPYCAQRRHDPCCLHRKDSCAVPISTTLCYCDEFCDRTVNGDCCPDYQKVCHGIVDPEPVPEPVRRCYHNGRYFTKFDGKIKDNCNLCECHGTGKTVCEKNVCLVDENLINDVNRISRSIGWTAKNYTEFWGRRYTEGLQLRLGTKEPTTKVKAMRRLTNTLDELPRNFNAIEEWRGMITDVKDQGWCGSSWAVSTASVASDRFGIQSKGIEFVHLAAQQLLSCVRKQQGCHGGHLDVAWNYFRKNGLVEEECYPYVEGKNICKVSRTDDLNSLGCRQSRKVPRTGLYKTGPAYSLNNETDIMSEIMKFGPVQATMRVYRDFFSYDGGIYRHTSVGGSEESGFHSVRIVGWGEERSGYTVTKFWLAANSWGTWWGERGYFRILRGVNECEIENYVLASWAHVHVIKDKHNNYNNNNHNNVGNLRSNYRY